MQNEMYNIGDTITLCNNGCRAWDFIITDKMPKGYKVWNIGKNIEDGWLPLVKTKNYQVVGTMYVMRCEHAQDILEACGWMGIDTPTNWEKFLKKTHKNGWRKWIEPKIKKALPYLKEIYKTLED